MSHVFDWQQDDYYSLLGVTRFSSDEDIHRAYRRKARENHPDRFPLNSPEHEAAQQRFLQIKQARDTLLDPAAREAYEREQELVQQAHWDALISQHQMPPQSAPVAKPRSKSRFRDSLQKAYEKAQEDSDTQRADFVVDDTGAHVYKGHDEHGDAQKGVPEHSRKNAANFYYSQGMRYAARGQYRRALYALNNAQNLDPELKISPHIMNKIRMQAYHSRR